jgi:hypothetical protein
MRVCVCVCVCVCRLHLLCVIVVNMEAMTRTVESHANLSLLVVREEFIIVLTVQSV